MCDLISISFGFEVKSLTHAREKDLMFLGFDFLKKTKDRFTVFLSEVFLKTKLYPKNTHENCFIRIV